MALKAVMRQLEALVFRYTTALDPSLGCPPLLRRAVVVRYPRYAIWLLSIEDS